MADLQNIKAGKAYVEMGVNNDALNKGLDDSESRVSVKLDKLGDHFKGFGIKLTAVGAAVEGFFALALKQVSDVEKLEDELAYFGEAISPKDSEAALLLADALNHLAVAGKMAAFQIGISVAEGATKAANRSRLWLKVIGDIARQNGPLIATVAGVAGALTIAGGAIYAVGTLLGSLTTIWATFSTVVGGATAVLGVFMSPLGVLAGLLLAGGGAWLYFSGAASAAVDTIKSLIGDIKGDLDTALKGIIDALKGGDLALAARIGWLTVELEFAKGTQGIRETWFDGLASMQKLWATWCHDVGSIWVQTHIDTMPAINNWFTWLKGIWRDAYSFLAKLMYPIATYDGFGGWTASYADYAKEIDDAQARDIVKDQQDLANKNAEAAKGRAGHLAELDADFARRMQEIEAEHGDNLKRLNDELKKLGDEWRRAVHEASKLPSQMSGLTNREVLINAHLRGSTSEGTFNINAAKLFGGGDSSIQERILKAQQEEIEWLSILHDDFKGWGWPRATNR